MRRHAVISVWVLALSASPMGLRPGLAADPPAKSTAAVAPPPANVLAGFSGRSDAPIDIQSKRLEVDDNGKTAVFIGDVVAVQGDYVLRTPQLEVQYEGSAANSAMSGSAPAPAPAATQAAPTPGTPAAQNADPATQISRILAKGPVVIDGKDGQQLTGDAADYDVRKQAAVVRGNVVLVQGKTGQRATSDAADYDAANEIAVLKGNVVLTQGENIVKGDRLWVNLKTNESKLETSGGATTAPGPDGKGCPPGRVCLHIPGEQKK